MSMVRRLGHVFLTALLISGCAGSTDAPSLLNDEPSSPPVTELNPFGARPATQSCVIPPAPPVGTMELRPAFPELSFDRPLWFGHAPGDSRIHYVVEQGGRILSFDLNAPDQTQVFFERPVYRANNEEGLLGLAFHPQFANNGRLYVFYSMNAPRRSVISEYTVNQGDRSTVDPTSERVILEVDQPYGNHNGGDLHFGPDGYLYISLGDGGSAADPLGHGQNQVTLLGSILRIDVDRTDDACGTPYGIPPDNPFAADRCQPGVEPAGAPEVWAWGLRNVWRMSFDRGTGLLWAGDVGQNAWEEIDVIEGGRNYGWKTVEGDTCFRGPCDPSDYAEPVFVYGHDLGKSVTGGFVYRGGVFPELWGQYVFGDYESGRIWAMDATGERADASILAASRSRIASFGETADGELLVVTFDRGILAFERSAGQADFEPIPDTLTATGCFADVAAHELSPGVYPYEVKVPFWSDHLVKTRAFALPPATQIRFDADGKAELPIGSIALKTFYKKESSGELTRVETRIIRRDARGWNGYSYRWRSDQSEADLLTGRTTVELSADSVPHQWTIPSRSECDHCHIGRLGYALGLSEAQLNRPIQHGEQLISQLDAFRAAGVLAQATVTTPERSFPELSDETLPLNLRVRAMLDTNCAPCHQPNGPADAEIDLRFGVPLSGMNICNVEPLRGEVDIPEGKLLEPGAPGRSLLLRRMQIRDKGQMPPLGSHLVDPVGTDLVARWIAELSDCSDPPE